MSALSSLQYDANDDVLEVIEQCLNSAEWGAERNDEMSVNCAAPTRWGECGGMFMLRNEPRAVHFSLSADMRAPATRRAAVLELLSMVNERLWMGHFEHWAEEGVIMYRHTLPLLDREAPERGEVAALMSAAAEAIEKFLPAFNFVIWAGKTPKDALKVAVFDTLGEA
ncbi:YbjN domain-containing protein [Hirschia litorea]|uniref:YbjN domain-containing protein n=1 Tax=Hirschia litorea TaxID=1199156 RepID=A0ABW2IM99_9PROT